jgi:activator of 2-hydroxyglutaryl-CoA dehydratase
MDLFLAFLDRVWIEHQNHPMIFVLYYVALGAAVCSPNRKVR